MTEHHKTSLILLSISIATSVGPVNSGQILEVVERISNKPLEPQEYEEALKWLADYQLIEMTLHLYKLTPRGQKLMDKIESRSKIIPELWRDTEAELQHLSKVV